MKAMENTRSSVSIKTTKLSHVTNNNGLSQKAESTTTKLKAKSKLIQKGKNMGKHVRNKAQSRDIRSVRR